MSQVKIQSFNQQEVNSQKGFLTAILLILLFAFIMPFQAKALDQSTQQLVANKLKATFSETTFTNLEPSPIKGLWQAEISNQIVYFSPEQELLLFGEVYSKDGRSLSEEARNNWQSKRIAKLDVSSAMVIGDGPIEIIEFTDPDCPFCMKFGDWVDQKNVEYKLANNGQDLFTRKVVMTPIASLHPNAHKEATHVLCTNTVDQSKALSDVFKGVISYADMLDCNEGKEVLKQHTLIAEAFGVSATPTLIIDGKIIQGFNKVKLDQIIKTKTNQIK